MGKQRHVCKTVQHRMERRVRGTPGSLSQFGGDAETGAGSGGAAETNEGCQWWRKPHKQGRTVGTHVGRVGRVDAILGRAMLGGLTRNVKQTHRKVITTAARGGRNKQGVLREGTHSCRESTASEYEIRNTKYEIRLSEKNNVTGRWRVDTQSRARWEG